MGVMSRRHRIRRIAKWVGLVMCVLIVVAWGVSLRWEAFYVGDGWRSYCGGGCLGISSCSAHDGDGWILEPYLGDVGLGFIWPKYVSNKTGKYPYTLVILPPWILLPAFAIPTAILLYRDRRRIPPGHCQKCGYNLTGNTSGKCPECGTACDFQVGGS